MKVDKTFTVTQTNRYIKSLLENDVLLCEIQVEGELSNFKRHSSGHLYFTLKDASAAINCVMFASYGNGLSFKPENGAKVIVTGHISLYEKTGQYQLYGINMKPMGEGGLAAAFVRMRDNLKAEGLFDDERKKTVPLWADCVALITSPTGAAVYDMINVIRGRNPGVKIVIVPTLVQGVQAAPDIVRSIELVNQWKTADSVPKVDVIILGRGGGSMEDLWAFNEEIVARAIEASKIAIISAVGHETDFTIADFVADVRAPTPSVAAVLAVADISEQFKRVFALSQRAGYAVNQAYTAGRVRFKALLSRPCLTRPLDALAIRRLHTQQLTKDMERLCEGYLKKCKDTLEIYTKLLVKVSPYTLWRRGYSAVYTKKRTIVRSVKEISAGQAISIRMQDGDVETKVLSVCIANNGNIVN